MESRQLLAVDFCNPFNPLDVNDDGFVAPLDALLVIDTLRQRGAQPLDASSLAPGPYIDTNHDGHLSPLDALVVINHLNDVGGERLPLVAGLTPQSDPNGNGVVLQSSVTLAGQTSPHSRVRLTRAGHATQETVADFAGRFQLALDLSPGDSELWIAAVDARRRGAALNMTVRHGDMVLDWNASLLNIVRDWTTVSDDPYPNRIVTSPPPWVARNLAMIHAAMYDAMNGIAPTHRAYRAELPAPAGASPLAAGAAAAFRVASQIYPESDELAILRATLVESMASVPDGPAKDSGIQFGERVGDAILGWRQQDGADAAASFTPSIGPGEWQRTFPDYNPPLLPHWPAVMPFAIRGSEAFRPSPPPPLTSAEYAAQVDEVMRLGGLNSVERTAEQTEIAIFWADGGGTFTPPGHWNQIAADVALAARRTPAENARLFALLNIALADAGIACWDAKYTYRLWRPIDAIRQADQDGNPATRGDSTWTPLLRTPPFPAYTSGHSTFSGAAEAVLAAEFGGNFAFSSAADGHSGFQARPLAAERVVRRHFTSFAAAADEASRSRIYGGIHFDFDGTAGLAAGRAIGRYVVAEFLVPFDE